MYIQKPSLVSAVGQAQTKCIYGQGMWDRLIGKGGEQKIFAAMKWKDVLLTSKY